MICENCGNELRDSDLFCASCGNKISTENRIRIKVPPNGEKFSLICAICGSNLSGKTWEFEKFCASSEASYPDVIGYACGICGFAYCYKGHKKELRKMGIHELRSGKCPICGTMLRGNNYRLITKLQIKPEKSEVPIGFAEKVTPRPPFGMIENSQDMKKRLVREAMPDILLSGSPLKITDPENQRVVRIDNSSSYDNIIQNHTAQHITLSCSEQQAGKFSIDLLPGEEKRVSAHIKAQPYLYGKQKYDTFDYELTHTEVWEVYTKSKKLTMRKIRG